MAPKYRGLQQQRFVSFITCPLWGGYSSASCHFHSRTNTDEAVTGGTFMI